MKEKELTAVEWLMTKLQSLGVTKEEHYELLCQLELEAKEMEDQQKVEFALRAYIEKLSPGKDFIEIVNSMRTFKQNNNESK
jgi:hypothetical protein